MFSLFIFHSFFQEGQLTPLAPMCGRPRIDLLKNRKWTFRGIQCSARTRIQIRLLLTDADVIQSYAPTTHFNSSTYSSIFTYKLDSLHTRQLTHARSRQTCCYMPLVYITSFAITRQRKAAFDNIIAEICCARRENEHKHNIT